MHKKLHDSSQQKRNAVILTWEEWDTRAVDFIGAFVGAVEGAAVEGAEGVVAGSCNAAKDETQR